MPSTRAKLPRIEQRHVDALERDIDAVNDDLPPLKSFVLPGGGWPSAYFHLARTVCRRCERLVVGARGQPRTSARAPGPVPEPAVRRAVRVGPLVRAQGRQGRAALGLARDVAAPRAAAPYRGGPPGLSWSHGNAVSAHGPWYWTSPVGPTPTCGAGAARRRRRPTPRFGAGLQRDHAHLLIADAPADHGRCAGSSKPHVKRRPRAPIGGEIERRIDRAGRSSRRSRRGA